MNNNEVTDHFKLSKISLTGNQTLKILLKHSIMIPKDKAVATLTLRGMQL